MTIHPRAMTSMREVRVNGRWPVLLPEHRARRPSWLTHEAARFQSIHDALEPGQLLWDVGAELGDHAAVFAWWGLRLVLVEPNPRAWPCIAATIGANEASAQVAGWAWAFTGDHPDPLEPNRYGVGGGVALTWPPVAAGPCDERAGMAHLSGRPDPDPYDAQPTTTIDALVALGLPAPDALTIDVEGAELKTIRGAATTLEVHRPHLWISIHDELMRGYGDQPGELHRTLLEAGYRGRRLATDHEDHWEWTPR